MQMRLGRGIFFIARTGRFIMDDGAILDEVFEMANLDEPWTGIPGIIFISTRMGAHGPRVKYFVRAGRNQPSFSVSVEKDPRVVVSSLPDRVTNEVAPKVISWVRQNRAALLEFWDEGDSWVKAQVDAHIAGLEKLKA